MRPLLALFALLGLLLTPLAASAATRLCLHDSPPAATAMAGDHHECCPEPGKSKPAKHDSRACAEACAMMGAGLAALPSAAPVLVEPERSVDRAALAPQDARTHPPSLPERPPRHLA